MGRKFQKNGGGRPSVMDPIILQKLEDAFSNAFTDEMACLYAGISKSTLYNYCTQNPEFMERKELLKKRPDLAAQRQLVADCNTTSGARWWAEHKMADFKPTSKIEHAGKIQTEQTVELTEDDKADIKAIQKDRARRRQEQRMQMA